MNKHTRLAIIVAPFLIVLGYVGSDYYLKSEAQQENLFQLVAKGVCDVLNQQCILSAGDFRVNVFDKNGYTTVNSTFPMQSVMLFLVDKNNHSIPYELRVKNSAYYWHAETPLRKDYEVNGSAQKIRLIIKIIGGQYFGEFETLAIN